MSATSQNPNQGAGYDAAGDVTRDGVNQYLYDGEGRVCAVANTPVSGFTSLTGYVYDADGNRVAKGTLTQFTCDLNPADSTYNGLTTAGNETDYVLGVVGEQVSEVAEDANGSMNWQRTYVYAAGMLFATYDPQADAPSQPLPSFRLTDWLGTLRATTDSYGVAQGTCKGMPFGDSLACSGNIPDDRYFTGKERDGETGLDYFGARYYASSMGRFMSPDWSAKVEPVPYAKMDDPQSLNLYEYVGNNPVTGVDPDGHFGPIYGHGTTWQSDCVQGNSTACGLIATNADDVQKPPAEQAGDEQDLQNRMAQQQNGSSSGGGFWHRLGQHLGNLAHLHSWNYNMRESVTFRILPAEPIPAVTDATDAAGLVGLASERAGKVLGPVGAAVSIWNDRSSKNIGMTLLGLVPGLETLAIPQAADDLLRQYQPGYAEQEDMPWDFSIHEPVSDSESGIQRDGASGLPVQDGGCLAAGMDGPC